MRLFKGSELSPPALPPYAANGIGLHSASDLFVTIHTYTHMEQGDLVELFWNDCFILAQQVQNTNHPLHLPVPLSFITDGDARVHYRVLRVGHPAQKSPCLTIPVKLQCPGGSLQSDGENQFLAAVQLPERVLREGLDLKRIKRGVAFSIEPWQYMAAMDCLTLRWGDLRLDIPPLLPSQVGQAVSGRIPKALLREAGHDPHLEATYCVIDRVGNRSGWAPGRQVRVYRASAS